MLYIKCVILQDIHPIPYIRNMKNSFSFQQFTIHHDRCAMKVGTDGVLLGAWANLSGAKNILDVGCGSGLIALMAAQRTPDARVWGIDVDAPSVEQAVKNVAASPFAARVNLSTQDVCTYVFPKPFDHILCNPPYYTEDTLPPEEARMRARHTAGLSLETLLTHVSRLLTPEGFFSLILPTGTSEGFITHALSQGWYVVRMCQVCTVARKPPKRTLLTLSRTALPPSPPEQLVLQDASGKRTAEYSALCAGFYL